MREPQNGAGTDPRAIMDKEDLVIWAASGLLLVVQSYRELFRELVNVDEEARNEQLAERTVALVVPDGVDCLVARNRRILGARASVGPSFQLPAGHQARCKANIRERCGLST